MKDKSIEVLSRPKIIPLRHIDKHAGSYKNDKLDRYSSPKEL